MHESNVTLKMWALLNCNEVEPSRKRDRERNKKISYATEMMRKEQISVGDFLEAMANNEVIFKNGL